MSLLKPTVFDGSLARQVQQGDVVGGAEVITLAGNGTVVTLTGLLLATGIVSSNPTAGAAYTLDTAANILASLTSGPGNFPVQNGITFRYRHIVTTAFAVTYGVTANTGISVTNGVINASSVKDFLLTVVNGTPPQTIQALTTNASAILTSIPAAILSTLTVGMVVLNAVAGLQGDTIIGINLAAGTVTLSGNANATNTTAVAVSFSPVLTVTGIGQGLL